MERRGAIRPHQRMCQKGGPQERRGRPCSPEAMGKEDSLKLLTVLVEIAITTQANMEVCGGLNSIAIGT